MLGLLLAPFIALAAAVPLRRDTDTSTARCPDFCAGTNSSSDLTSTYVCGDARLGPIDVPQTLPLASIAGLDSTYHRFGGLCPGEFLAKYTNATSGEYIYPPFFGYSLTTNGTPAFFNLTLSPGTFLDRFGSEYGRYMSPAGAPYAQRSLPPTNLNAAPGAQYPYNYHVYVVTEPFVAQGGMIAGWFEQQGMGLQFFMPLAVGELVNQGMLGRINLTSETWISKRWS